MNRTLVATLVAALALTPMAAASWGFKGSYEPDTTRDADDGWMHTQPDTTPTTDSPVSHMVYLNGFLAPTSSGEPLHPSTYSSRLMTTYPQSRLYAMMGVWKDCNNDGYVGFGDNGLFEYRTELLTATFGASICPPGAIPPNPIPYNWFPEHNDGQWVHEFIPIMWNRAEAERIGDQNPWNLNDNASRLWADFALPEKDAAPLSCPLSPAPVGTLHSTGGVVWYVDCIDGYKGTDTWNTLVSTAGGDNLGLGQLSFKDAPREQHSSQSVLNVKNPWGEEDDASYVNAWDCSSPPTPVTIPAIPGVSSQENNIINVSNPSTSPAPNAGGSISGTLNSTAAGFDECNRNAVDGGFGGSVARVPYSAEGGTIAAAIRRNPDNWFTPIEAGRPAAPWSAVLGRGTPGDFGTRDDNLATTADGVWQGQTNWINPVLANRAKGEIEEVRYWTYYAYVSPAAVSAHKLTLPKGTNTGTFGFDQCGTNIGAGSPVLNGWDCDPTHWFRDANGNSIEPAGTWNGGQSQGPGTCNTATLSNQACVGVRVGQAYNLRDIDCYDISAQPAREQGVSWGAVTGTACQYAS